jgi:transposase
MRTVLELPIEDLEASLAAKPAEVRPPPRDQAEKPVRRPLPEHLPREEIVHENPCACPAYGGELRRLGEDVSEMLEYVPGRYKVLRHVRPKLSCSACQKIVQPDAPSRPIERGLAGPGLLAHVLVSKYSDHLPLYRQSQIFAREGIDLDRSTLADWVGGASALLEPLVNAICRYVLSHYKVHGDDTPVPVLCPGRGTTKQGRLWTYVRDDRPAASEDPPAVFFRYSPDRKGERPRAHLAHFSGILQADAYAGFDRLYGERIQEAACWAHCPESVFIRSSRASTAEILLPSLWIAPDNNSGRLRWMRGTRGDRASATRVARERARARISARNARARRASSVG